jgi:hypothetical protein
MEQVLAVLGEQLWQEKEEEGEREEKVLIKTRKGHRESCLLLLVN